MPFHAAVARKATFCMVESGRGSMLTTVATKTAVAPSKASRAVRGP